MSGSLEKILRLNAKHFKYKADEYPEFNFDTKEQSGLIAQEMQEVFPDLVTEIEEASLKEGDDQKGETYLAVNYMGLIPALVQAIKEQQEKIEALENALKSK